MPASVTDLAELAITNPVGTALAGPLTLHVGLVLAGGNLDAGPHLVAIAAGGTVARSSGHVIGRLQKTIPAGGPVSVNFEIGDALGYTPLQASWETVTVAGTLTASTSAGDDVAGLTAVGLVPAASVNRTWTIGSSGLVVGPTTLLVSYLSTDLDPAANPAALLAAISTGGISSLPTVTLRTATSLTMSLAGAPERSPRTRHAGGRPRCRADRTRQRLRRSAVFLPRHHHQWRPIRRERSHNRDHAAGRARPGSPPRPARAAAP